MNLALDITREVEKVLLGKPESVKLAVTCFLAEGHLLIDDIPGVGKTTLALALARSVGCQFQRIQFTSDLLPSDVLGVSVFDPKDQAFHFKPGPVFHNVVLADEINRASPKTQSALLEAMQEGQVSIDSQTHALPRPFFLIATQNPHEYHGSFPLPESQLDRFMMRINLGYPDESIEAAILKEDSLTPRAESVKPVTDPSKVLDALKQVRNVSVEESVNTYMVQLARGTRDSGLVDLGLSPRGTLALRRAAQSYAWCSGRTFVTPDDVKAVAAPVMAHRLQIRGNYNGNTVRAIESMVMELVNQVPVPA